jgi:hypothetical protein
LLAGLVVLQVVLINNSPEQVRRARALEAFEAQYNAAANACLDPILAQHPKPVPQTMWDAFQVCMKALDDQRRALQPWWKLWK